MNNVFMFCAVMSTGALCLIAVLLGCIVDKL